MWGLTFTNLAEATCAGRPLKVIPKCYQKGVCKYGTRAGKVVTTFKTPAGKGGSVAQAAANTVQPAHTGARYDYAEALTKGLLFFDSLVSGKFEATHKRLTWRENSCQECVDKKYKKNLSGGFYESGGSYLKFPILNAYMANMLAWVGLEERGGLNGAGVLADLRWKVKWAADYLVDCNVAPNVYMGLNGNYTLDFDYYGPPELASKYVSSKPFGYITKANKGSEILADSAAALAASAMLFKDKPKVAALYLKKAAALYEWAVTSPGSINDNKDPVMKQHKDLYPSSGYVDNLAWAAVWMYKATKSAKYLADAKKYYAQTSFNTDSETFQLDNKRPGLSVLLAGLTDDVVYAADATKYFDAYLSQKVQHTPRGLAYPYHWGGGRFGGNVAWLAVMYAKNKNVDAGYRARLRNYAFFQVNYYLGDSGRSWMVGYGDYQKGIYVWHKQSYNSILDFDTALTGKILAMPPGPWASGRVGPGSARVERGKLDMEGSATPQRRVPYGYVVTPLADDNMVGSRKDYTYTEWTLEYPCGLIGALAHTAGWYKQGPYKGKMTDVLPFKG